MSATADDAVTTKTVEAEEDVVAEQGDISDDEDILHGPCNEQPIGCDEDARFVVLYFMICCHIFTNNAPISIPTLTGVALLVNISQRNLLSTLMKIETYLLGL